MTPRERWLAAIWPFVRDSLPAAPARVLDVGCGPLGGLVPVLRRDGYDAVGIDPQAPDEEHYQRVEFEHAELPENVDAVVLSTSLHHVADPAQVIDRVDGVLASGGVAIVVEWAWEDFDRPTADWCFERLRPDDEPGWLHRRYDEWLASDEEWTSYVRGWAEREGLHRGDLLVRLLDERFERRRLSYGPYYFADLADTTSEDERTAIDAGAIRPNRIEYVGARRQSRLQARR
jgi:SAM-dependent methyltransferase